MSNDGALSDMELWVARREEAQSSSEVWRKQVLANAAGCQSHIVQLVTTATGPPADEASDDEGQPQRPPS